MSNIEIKHLLRNSRLPENDISLLIFMLYLPFGLLIFTLRLILLVILIVLGQILPYSQFSQKLIYKCACFALGISVTVENPKAKEEVRVYVSNSRSALDHLAVSNMTGAVPANRSILDRYLELNHLKLGSPLNMEVFKNNIQQFLSKKTAPLYFAPEGRATNGKSLLKFKPYPFQFTTKVQPICISIDRPLLDISINTLGSTYLNDVFYFMFCPITNYKLRFLASLEKKVRTDEEFAEDVRESIANSLQVELVSFTSHDVAEWEKRKLAEEQQRSQVRFTPNVATLNPELQRMTMQIREVLPHVPFNAIYNDLYATRNIDSTITNILEGRVRYIPEQTSPTQQSQTSSSPISSSSSPSTSISNVSLSSSSENVRSGSGSSFSFNTAAASFPKSASERSKSFQERKEQLIASARRRYIEKHNLDIPI